jgi:hypothetical protein
MAGSERLKAVAAKLGAVVRRWPKFTVTALAVVFLSVVPVWPFFPTCDIRPPSSDTERLYVRMSDEYRSLVKNGFNAFGVYYWDIGGILLIRFLPFLDGEPLFDQHDAILNSERKAAGHLVSEAYDGRVIAGKIYRIPGYLRDLLDANPGRYDYERCDIMRVIVTGKPPEIPAVP